VKFSPVPWRSRCEIVPT